MVSMQRFMRTPLLLRSSSSQALLALMLSLVIGSYAFAADDAEHFFEKEIRPLLIENCQKCHGEEKQEGALRLDSRDSILKGGDSGPALVTGKSAESLLMKAVRHQDGLEMPPKKSLRPEQIDALAHWIDAGASWPVSANAPMGTKPKSIAERARDHWAFHPIQNPPLPTVKESTWVRTPVDAFVLAQLEKEGLSHSPEADRRTLIRRVYVALTGLPPTPEQVEAFVADADPNAYEKLVDQLLDSPHYGEQWGRHWLDVARYSDTKGYVYAREERFWTHAWAYRDWVVQALNRDLPYDRFLMLQLAADQVPDHQPSDLAAMGFLTVGRRFLGVKHDIIDDRIDAIFRGTMGLTVGCARCHDHKYDPIPTKDYYSMYGVLDSCMEKQVRIGAASDPQDAFEAELSKRQEKLTTTIAKHREESSSRVRARVGDYLAAQFKLGDFPEEGFDQILQPDDLLPAFVRRFQFFLRKDAASPGKVFVAWHLFSALTPEEYATKGPQVLEAFQKEVAAGKVNPLVAAAFATAPANREELCKRYGDLFTSVNMPAPAPTPEVAPETATAQAELRAFLFGENAVCQVPDLPIVHSENYFQTSHIEELWRLQGEVDRWINQNAAGVPYALALYDRPTPSEPIVFRRGNPANKGDAIPRQNLELIAGQNRAPFAVGSGRLELAQSIVAGNNPLTSRVIVNRIWAHHFGAGLVSTPSDFGTRAAPPSHPELLDWLATHLMQEGWSLKRLHKWIVLSSTYRQAVTGPSDEAQRQLAQSKDPSNRLLWKRAGHRLTFEELCDSLLAVTGGLDMKLGGKPSPMLTASLPQRRMLYGLVDRQFLPSVLRVFDFANPDLHIPQRSETTVPQQALFFLNHPFLLQQAKQLAKQVPADAAPEAGIRMMFRKVYQREPSEQQVQSAVALLKAAAEVPPPPPEAETAKQWSYAYGEFDPQTQRTKTFTPLPHFTGSAWQGGPNWPDGKIGWAQITASGGHPGNDLAHAIIRRWTAPRAMHLKLKSQVTHEVAQGDGIRVQIVSSQQGVIASSLVHNKMIPLDMESLNVQAGETLDFVVDIAGNLNSDQHFWRATLQELDVATNPGDWNSERDFTTGNVPELTPWEQLAQVLLCSNEFLFVD
ncbi:MAG: PSD1 and planctomycete cytochrome C domain-containing protein [Planctomycetaceae bacterium]